MKASLQPGKSFGSAASSAPAQRKGGLKTIADNRPSTIAQRKLQAMVQRKGIVQRAGQNTSTLNVAQLRPIKVQGTENEYFDSDYNLSLIQLRYDKYQIKDTETVLFFENGEGYYTDEELKNKVNMSQYVTGDREGISNARGKMYDCRDEGRDGLICIETAKNILERFFKSEPQHMEVNETKVARVLDAFANKVPLPPIVINPGADGKAALVDGRHRIIASVRHGHKYVPFTSSIY